MNIRRAGFRFLMIMALLTQLTSVALAQSEPSSSGSVTPAASGGDRVSLMTPQRINLMDPIKHLISGPGWLVAEGLEVRPFGKFPDRFDPLDREPIESFASPFAGMGTTLGQGGTAGVLVPFRDPAPAFSRSLLVTRDFSARTLQTEPDIAVNPNDPDHLVLGVIDYNFPSNSAYVSIDGGENWQGPIQTKYVRDDLASGGDPVVKFDQQGNVYMASISIGVKEYKIGNAVGFTEFSSIAVAASNDGGFKWNDPVAVGTSKVEFVSEESADGGGGGLFGSQPRGKIKIGFLDKPWMAVGPHPTIEEQEVIYVSYVEFITQYDIVYLGEIPVLGAPEVHTTPWVVNSQDGGQTWSDPVKAGPTVRQVFGAEEGGSDGGGESKEEANPEAQNPSAQALEQLGQTADQQVLQGYSRFQEGEGGEPEGERRTVQGVTPAVDSKGNLYIFWFDSTDDESQKGLGEFYMAKSEDAGQTFSKPKKINSFLEPGYRSRTAFFRFWATVFPRISIGPNDEIYITYSALPADRPQDEADVFFIRSTDGGSKWSRPKRLNVDETDAAQFYPSIATSPNGTIHVMWGDFRDDPIQTRYHIYYTSSEDGGETWGFKNEELGLDVGDTRVTDFPTNPNKAFSNGLFIGDYFAIAATDEDAYLVWADGRLGEYGGVNQKIGFARKRQVPNPEIFLSPDTGPGGETITVQGFGFQPNINYYLQVGGGSVAAGRTNDNGEMSSTVFVPISGEGAHPVSLVDESGNVASTTFYMEFGFDNIQKNLEMLDQELDALVAAVPVTNTSGSGGGVLQQEVKYDRALENSNARVAQLESQVEQIAAQMEGQQPAVNAAGGFGGTSPLAFALVGLAGLLLGAALTRLRATRS